MLAATWLDEPRPLGTSYRVCLTMKHNFILCLTVLVANAQVILSATAAETNAVLAGNNSVLLELSAAAAYLQDLKKLGALPGVATNSDMNISSGRLPASILKELKYPFAVTLRVTLGGDSFTNHYTAMRPTAAAAWQLKKAWQTDSQGRTVETWPVKSIPSPDIS